MIGGCSTVLGLAYFVLRFCQRIISRTSEANDTAGAKTASACGVENIYPAEIETRLVEHPKLEIASVIGIKDERYGEVIGCFVEGDRGRHVLSGNPNMRGPHRTRPWFSGLVHYSFLDDVRTQRVVGEPKDGGNPAIIQMDKDLGFWYAGTADFAHKRSVIALVSRENYFKVAALHWGEEMGFEGERVKKTEAKL